MVVDVDTTPCITVRVRGIRICHEVSRQAKSEPLWVKARQTEIVTKRHTWEWKCTLLKDWNGLIIQHWVDSSINSQSMTQPTGLAVMHACIELCMCILYTFLYKKNLNLESTFFKSSQSTSKVWYWLLCFLAFGRRMRSNFVGVWKPSLDLAGQLDDLRLTWITGSSDSLRIFLKTSENFISSWCLWFQSYNKATFHYLTVT